jgi:hypothetical protein
MAVHGGPPKTEEGLLAFGDAPNITAAWILTGWFSFAIGGVVVWVIRRKPLEPNPPEMTR